MAHNSKDKSRLTFRESTLPQGVVFDEEQLRVIRSFVFGGGRHEYLEKGGIA